MFWKKKNKFAYTILKKDEPLLNSSIIRVDNIEISLKDLGENGWELINTILDINTKEYIYYFKKEI